MRRSPSIPLTPFSTMRPLGILSSMNRDSPQAAGLRWWIPINEGNAPSPGGSHLPKRYYGSMGFDAETNTRQQIGGTAPTWAVDPYGTHGVSLDFSGGSLLYETDTGVVQPVFLPTTNTCALTAWIQTRSTGNYRGIVGAQADDGIGFSLLVSGAGANPLGYVWTNDGTDYNAATNLFFDTTNGLWQFVAIVITPTAGVLYMGDQANGFQSFTNTATHSAKTWSTWAWTVGDDRGTARYWDGRIADVRIYERSLSDAEVYQIYDPATRWDLYRPRSSRFFLMEGAAAAATPSHPVFGAQFRPRFFPKRKVMVA